jgi:hypothetical protein
MRLTRPPRGRRLARLRRLAEQRDRLFGVQQVLDPEPTGNSVFSDTAHHEALDITEDLEACDELPLTLRRRLHELTCSFSAVRVREVLSRPANEIILNLARLERRDIDDFYTQRGLTYVGTICRYHSALVYKRRPSVYKDSQSKETPTW